MFVAAFTLPPEPAGFVVLRQLTRDLSLVCDFCPPDQVRDRIALKRYAEVHPGPSAGLPSDLSSRSRAVALQRAGTETPPDSRHLRLAFGSYF